MGVIWIPSSFAFGGVMQTVNVQPTVDVINQTAARMEEYAADIRRIGLKISETGDLERTADVVNAVTNCIMNLRLDLLITRPLREMRRLQAELDSK